MRDPEVRVAGLDLDALNGLDRVRDGWCSRRTRSSWRRCGKYTRSKMEMGDVSLFFQEVDELSVTKLAKIPL